MFEVYTIDWGGYLEIESKGLDMRRDRIYRGIARNSSGRDGGELFCM